MLHWNAEGVRNKKLELQVLLKERNIDVCCIQETHLNSSHRFSIRGYDTFRRDRKNRPKGGILAHVKNTHAAAELNRSEDEDTEVLGIKLLLDKNPLTIYNLYPPPNKQLRPQVFQSDPDRWIIMGDFNSHSPSWGYDDLDHKGDEVEDWIITHNMVLINKADDPPTFYSRAWRSTSCPELAIATDDVAKINSREVDKQLGESDHKSIFLTIECQKTPPEIYQSPSWNFKKANWEVFKKLTGENCKNIKGSSLCQNELPSCLSVSCVSN